MDSKKIGEYIQAKRKEVGLTQSQLGDCLGVTSKAVSKWETGVAIPDVALFSDLTKTLNITIEELLKGEDNKVIPVAKKKNYVIIGLSILIFLLIVLSISLFVYFKNNYSKVDIYKIESANDSFHVDGTLTNIDGNSYLSITNVEYLGDEFDLLDSVYDFEYELYFRDQLLFESGKNKDNANDKNYILKNELSSIYFFIDGIKYNNISLNNFIFYLRINFLDSDSNLKNIDIVLKIIG